MQDINMVYQFDSNRISYKNNPNKAKPFKMNKKYSTNTNTFHYRQANDIIQKKKAYYIIFHE